MSDHGEDSDLPGRPSSPSHLSNIGLDLLVNAKKKTLSHDAISILSSGSGRSKHSHRYVDDPVESKANARDEWMSVDRSSDESSTRSRPKARSNRGKREVGSDTESVRISSKKEPEERNDDYWMRKPRSDSEASALKRELLYEFERMRTKGHRLPRICTPETPLEEMQAEYMRLKRDRELDAGVMFQRQMLMTCVSGIEFLSTNVSPFDCKLDGWSHHVNDRLESYDDILEELYAKYKGAAKMAPELRLLMALGGSAMMFSMQNRMANLAESMMYGGNNGKRGHENRKEGGGMFGNLSGLFSGFFGAQGGAVNEAQVQQPDSYNYQPAQPMRGPTLNVDSVLKNLQQSAFDRNNDMQRVEIISTVSESDIPDDASLMSGSFPVKVKSMPARSGRRTLDLSM